MRPAPPPYLKVWIRHCNASNRNRICSFYENETTISGSCKMYISSFGKIYVVTVCLEDIYGRYCIQKSNNHITSTRILTLSSLR